MNKSPLGKLEKVDLREFWESEAGDFTPWLAQEQNIALLGETIGLELEVEAQEKNVGPFKADILCRETVNDHWVLIENQLERTDHTHLGQLLTYAAGLNAVTIVWIADRFTDEHRAALDWLNEITDDTFNFFGLEVELWRIGDSPLAPKFNIISKPNDWTRTITTAATRMKNEDLTDTKLLQLEYWQSFRDYLENINSPIRPQKPSPQHWTNISTGRSNFTFNATLNTSAGTIGVELAIVGPDAKPHYYLLERQKEAIEAEMNEKLEWRENPEKKQSYIRLRVDHDPTDKEKWPEQHKWMKEKLEMFRNVLGPRVKELDASEYQDE
ncbi:MAG: DUF4268 domain-containing protein [Nitrospinota bacterium]|nr:DUF4268 domain-containing protein [Nitrospinota bacterium]